MTKEEIVMTKEEIECLKDAINGLMRAYNAKPLDEAAMGIWTLSLRSLEYRLVRAVIIKWAQTQKYLPKPNDIVQAVHQVRLNILEKKRQEAADADRRDRQENGEKVNVQERINAMHKAIDNGDEGTLRSLYDDSVSPPRLYTKEELYVRNVLADTAHMGAPAVYIERAKRFLEASKHGIKLSPMQITWAEKVLEG